MPGLEEGVVFSKKDQRSSSRGTLDRWLYHPCYGPQRNHKRVVYRPLGKEVFVVEDIQYLRGLLVEVEAWTFMDYDGLGLFRRTKDHLPFQVACVPLPVLKQFSPVIDFIFG